MPSPLHVGPYPLTGGIQLDAARGRPTGLIDALNFEARDGACRARKGQTLLAAVTGTTTLGIVTKSPTPSWAGQTVTYLGFPGIPAAERTMRVTLSGNLAEDDNDITVEFYGDDNAWHTCYVINADRILNGDTTSLPSFYMLVPSGWQNANPGLSATKYWLRITKTSTTWASTVVSASGYSDVRGPAPVLYAFTARSGPRCILATAGFIWAVYDVDRKAQIAGLVGTTPVANGDRVVMQYMPATDEVLIVLGQERFRWNVGTGEVTTFAPRYGDDLANTAYEDISTENDVPIHGATAMYGERVFLLDMAGNPHGFRWSAPGVYWDVFPSTNYATLASRGAGKLLAGAVMGGALYLFTATSIWRAQLGDPTADSESELFIDLVEETGCCAGRSVVVANGRILFLSEDGVREFDGTRSRRLTADVDALFRVDSGHPFACLRKRDSSICAVWHRLTNEYRLYYPSASALENDCELAIDLGARTCWLHGASLLPTTSASAPIGQRLRGVRASGAVWHESLSAVVGVDVAGIVSQHDMGDRDIESPRAAFLETHHLGFANANEKILSRVDLHVERENFRNVLIGAVPDGDRARLDTRMIDVEPDLLDETAAIGEAAIGATMLQLDQSHAPITARFHMRGRNFRLRVETIDPHPNLAIDAFEADVLMGGRR